jgi:hypothetical protein
VSKKIKKTEISKSSTSGIQSTKLNPQGISFSFKYYQDDHDKFSCREKAAPYWLALVNRLKALSGSSHKELMADKSKSLRCHAIQWEKTTQNNGFGFPEEEQLVDTPYQLSISSNEHGRVHGFFIGEIFYVVWLDPDHLLYAK